MQALVFFGKNDIRLQDVPIQRPNPHEVLIKVAFCGVCGTDFHIFDGNPGASEVAKPCILGHEFSGTLVEVGDNVKSLKVGDTVCINPNKCCGICNACRTGREHFCENMTGYGTTRNGGFADYCTLHEQAVYKLPKNVNLDEAALIEPLACCLHGADLTDIQVGDVVVVIGAGTIGQIMIQLAKMAGASSIVVSEPAESRRLMALSLGANVVLDPMNVNIVEELRAKNFTHINKIIECVGNKHTILEALSVATAGATVMMFGLTEPNEEINIKPYEVFRKELTIRASYINPYTHLRAISLLVANRIQLKSIISQRIPLKKAKDVFYDPNFRKAGKVLIEP